MPASPAVYNPSDPFIYRYFDGHSYFITSDPKKIKALSPDRSYVSTLHKKGNHYYDFGKKQNFQRNVLGSPEAVSAYFHLVKGNSNYINLDR